MDCWIIGVGCGGPVVYCGWGCFCCNGEEAKLCCAIVEVTILDMDTKFCWEIGVVRSKVCER